MPQYAGMPEDRANIVILECGCTLVRVGPPDREIYQRKCEEHRDPRPA
jgi:hypothetical protein